MQKTISKKISTELQEGFRAMLETEGFELRSLNHAFWQARGPGAVVSFYQSGKLVLQGKNAVEIARMLGVIDDKPACDSTTAPQIASGARAAVEAPAVASPYAPAIAKLPTPAPSRWIGIDEAGKGDYFGPLVVAAALVEDSQLGWLEELGVGDSKRIPDGRIIELDHLLRDPIAHSVVMLLPETYNRLYGQMKNLNLLLAWGHATAAAELLEKHDAELILSDQFTRANHVQRALDKRQIRVPFVQRTRAEDDPAVGVASIFARAAFLRGMRKLSRESGVKLPLGAGAPIVPAGKKLVARHGPDALERYAKTHFKTTAKILG